MRRPAHGIQALLGALAFLPFATGLAGAHPGSGIGVDRQGNVHFVDTGGGVLEIGKDGKLTRDPGPAFHWMTVDAGDRFSKVRLPSFPFGEITVAGANPTLILSSDVPVVVGRDGNLYYPQLGRESRLQIMRLTPAGGTSVAATLPAKTIDGRPLLWVNGLAAGPDDTLYFTENRAVMKIAKDGTVSMVATVRLAECSPVPGTEDSDQPYLRGLDVDAKGDVYVAASGCGSLLEVTRDGRVATLLRAESPWSPTGATVTASGVYVLEYFHTTGSDRRMWLPRVRKLTADGKVVTLAAIEHR